MFSMFVIPGCDLITGYLRIGLVTCDLRHGHRITQKVRGSHADSLQWKLSKTPAAGHRRTPKQLPTQSARTM